ncbi:MAG: hypothetical protein AAFW70_29900, partial [Cyanobacteria bacterium J06635_10]
SITYSSALTMEITAADNRLTVLLNPDGNTDTFTIYTFDANYAVNPGATIDLTECLNAAGGSGKLVFIGSNFGGPGKFTINIKSDGNTTFTIDEGVAPWVSKQWNVDISKS